MKRFRLDLRRDRNQKKYEEDQRAQRISQLHCHRERIAARFPQSGRRYFNDPERERDLRNLTRDGPTPGRFRAAVRVWNRRLVRTERKRSCFHDKGSLRRYILPTAAHQVKQPIKCPTGLLYAARFCLATLAPCLPNAVRVAFERCEIFFFFFAAAAAFLMFFFAAVRCFALAMSFSLQSFFMDGTERELAEISGNISSYETSI